MASHSIGLRECGRCRPDPSATTATAPLPLTTHTPSPSSSHPHSVYCDALGSDYYTTWKRREQGEPALVAAAVAAESGHTDAARGAVPCPETRRVIDYLWHSPHLRPHSVLRPPEDGDVPPERLPCAAYPSDHVALCAEFSVVG